MANRLPVGKLPPELLARLLADHVETDDPELLVGPALGEDAAAVDLGGGQALILASDPVTFATESIGHYAVHVNANDVATMGARPRWYLATLLLPPGCGEEAIEAIYSDVAAACRKVGATWCGGHTEISADLPRPIVVGTMVGVIGRDRLVRTGDARPGDRLLCTKFVPLEATALLAREWPDWAARTVGKEEAARARGLLDEPGISVVDEALAAARSGAGALHDPTEGGLASGVRELATAAGVGVRVDAHRIPVDPGASELCAAAGLDPLGALGSGSLLVTVPPERVGAVGEAIRDAGVACREIGEITPAGEGVSLVRDGVASPFPAFDVDEIARLVAAGGPPGHDDGAHGGPGPRGG